jgi:hypothetical protein
VQFLTPNSRGNLMQPVITANTQRLKNNHTSKYYCFRNNSVLLYASRQTANVDIMENTFLNIFVTVCISLSYTARSESRCALRLQYADLVVSIEVAVEVCCCFTVFSCKQWLKCNTGKVFNCLIQFNLGTRQ